MENTIKNNNVEHGCRINHLVYISHANKLFSCEELLHLLKIARKRNQENGITGLLLYKDGSFMQVLEGSVNDIETVFASIKGDARHSRVRTLLYGPITSRMFNQWYMGFYNIDNLDSNEFEGFSHYLRNAHSIQGLIDHPSDALKILEYFRARS